VMERTMRWVRIQRPGFSHVKFGIVQSCVERLKLDS
jgi:hypothetical protein